MASPLITLSESGQKFIKDFEGFRSMPYKDTGSLWTIGYGTQIDAPQVGRYPDGIAVDHAQALFLGAVNKVCNKLMEAPFAGFTQWQYDAIISFAYNTGWQLFSTSTLYKQLAIRSIDLSSWLWYVKDASDKTDEGLMRRRRAEMKIFIYGLYV